MPQRQAFLADAVEVLSRSLDYHETLRALAWLVVPTIADWCAVDMMEGGTLERLAVAHRDPEKIALVTEVQERSRNPRSGVRQILETGKPIVVPEITREMLEATNTGEVLEKVLAIGLRSYIAVPLRRGGVVVGAITLATAESGRTFDAADLSLATALADRASIAIEHAHLFRKAQTERERLQQLVEASPIAIGIMRPPDYTVEMANVAFNATYGGRNMLGVTMRELDPTNQRIPDLDRVVATGEPSTKIELPVTFDWSGTGIEETRYFNTTRAPLRDENGVVDSIVAFPYDVTEQVLARKRIADALATAESANRAKDEFLAMLGHELRNPLAPIMTALELMQLRSPDVFQRERTVIERQVRHLVRLVDDLLDVSRITRGGVELHRETVDLADIVAKAIEQASPLLEEKKHELVTRVERGALVDGDPVRLAQIVANLVTNAAKYTERTGTITITVEHGDGLARVRVRDTGIGLAPDVVPLVFDAFYQVRQSIDRARGGLGLGLAIVKSLAHAHGGTASASSEGIGKGSEFVLTLPSIDGGVIPRATGTPVHGTFPVRPERIMIVDDNLDALSLLADALSQRGFETLRAHDAPSALAIAEQSRPHIALLDIGLPVIDGYELAKRLRAIDGLAKLQLVALTGYGQAADVARSHASGFDAHLVKPIEIDTVLDTIERLITRARSVSLR